MTTQLHDVGEEFERKLVFTGSASKPTNLGVGMYHDGEVSGDTTNGDNLTDSADVGDITTEPSGGNYARQTVAFDGTRFSVAQNTNGDWEATTDSNVVFDTTNTTGTVDAYFVTVDWDQNADGTVETHLYFTGNLSQTRDLSNYTEISVETVGFSQD